METFQIIFLVVIAIFGVVVWASEEKPLSKLFYKKLKVTFDHFNVMKQIKVGKIPDNLRGFRLTEAEYNSIKHLLNPKQRKEIKKRIVNK